MHQYDAALVYSGMINYNKTKRLTSKSIKILIKYLKIKITPNPCPRSSSVRVANSKPMKDAVDTDIGTDIDIDIEIEIDIDIDIDTARHAPETQNNIERKESTRVWNITIISVQNI